MSVLPVCMNMNHVAPSTHRDQDIRPPSTGITSCCEPPCICWVSDSGPLEEQQQVLLIIEPFLQFLL